MNDQVLYTINETAAILKVSRPTVYKLIEDRKIEAIRITPQRQRITKASLDSFLQANTIPPTL